MKQTWQTHEQKQKTLEQKHDTNMKQWKTHENNMKHQCQNIKTHKTIMKQMGKHNMTKTWNNNKQKRETHNQKHMENN